MPLVSYKGKTMPESPIRKLVPFAEKAVKEGKEIFHLNIGQPDIKTPEEALSAIKNHTVDILSYSHSAGFESFRNKLVSYYNKHNVSITAQDMLITTGGSEALLFTLGCITDPNDEIIVPEPFYANYYGFFTQADVKVTPIVSKLDQQFALPAIEEFEKKITNKTKAILICNPGNPTGYLYTKEEIKQLTDLVIKYDIFLVADEVYREFVYDGASHYSILEEDKITQHAIVIDSFSKTYSMCGARIGCLISKNKDVINTAMKFAQARLSPPTFAQIASEAALEVPESYYQQTVEKYKGRRDLVIEELHKIPNITVNTPNGAFYCIVKLPIHNADHFSEWLLDKFHIDNQTIMLAPASGFYATKGLGTNEVRIAYVLNKKKLKKAIFILKHALEQYPNPVL